MGTSQLEKAKELIARYQQALRKNSGLIKPIPKPGCPCTICVLDNAATEFLKPTKPEVPRAKEDLPSIASLGGSDPHFTGDMTTEEYIRRGREEGP